jgi:hypothetical protein
MAVIQSQASCQSSSSLFSPPSKQALLLAPPVPSPYSGPPCLSPFPFSIPVAPRVWACPLGPCWAFLFPIFELWFWIGQDDVCGLGFVAWDVGRVSFAFFSTDVVPTGVFPEANGTAPQRLVGDFLGRHFWILPGCGRGGAFLQRGSGATPRERHQASLGS